MQDFQLSPEDASLVVTALPAMQDAVYDDGMLRVPTAQAEAVAAIVADLPAIVLERGRADTRRAVNAKRDQVIGGGYQHNFGGTAGIRTLDQRSESDAINWLGLKNLADAAIAAGSGADPMQIRDAGDETFTASANVVASALVSMAQWRGAVMSRSWALKDAIAAAADAAALAAIDIETGWPG